jgi:hypothetical protein
MNIFQRGYSKKLPDVDGPWCSSKSCLLFPCWFISKIKKNKIIGVNQNYSAVYISAILNNKCHVWKKSDCKKESFIKGRKRNRPSPMKKFYKW